MGFLPILVSRDRLRSLEELERLVMEEELRDELEEQNLATFLNQRASNVGASWTQPASMDAPLPQVNHKAGECVAKFISPYQVPMGMN